MQHCKIKLHFVQTVLAPACSTTEHSNGALAGLVVMFGSTYNGQFEDVEAADKMISKIPLPKPIECDQTHLSRPYIFTFQAHCSRRCPCRPSATAAAGLHPAADQPLGSQKCLKPKCKNGRVLALGALGQPSSTAFAWLPMFGCICQ